MKPEVILSFAFGTVFLLIALAFALVAFYLPKPANPEAVGLLLYVMQVVLAISASGVAAVIPGFLSLTLQSRLGPAGTFGIRAGGAIAVFVLVFLVNPRSITLDQMNKRVGFDEKLEACRSFIPIAGAPLSGALQYCMEAKNFDPSRWEVYRQLARVYYAYNEFDKSIENYKLAISKLIGKSSDDIMVVADVGAKDHTDFQLMAYGIAMGYVGLANSLTDKQPRLDALQSSLNYLSKATWFVTPNLDQADQLRNQLVYTEALDYSYVWMIDDNQAKTKEEFDRSTKRFEEFLLLPGITPQWAEYHLACLYATAIRKTMVGVDSQSSEQQSKDFLRRSLTHLLQAQTDKSVIQDKLMRCRLLDPDYCQPPRGPEPMICRCLTPIVSGDATLSALVAKL